MGIHKGWKNKENAERQFENLKANLFESTKPFFLFSGSLDLSKKDPTVKIGDTLARIVNATLVLSEDENHSYFGADSVFAQKVIVENNNLIKFWGEYFGFLFPKGIKRINQDTTLFMVNLN